MLLERLKNLPNHDSLALGAVLGAVAVVAVVFLNSCVTATLVDWGNWLFRLLGVLTPFLLYWVVARLVAWRKG